VNATFQYPPLTPDLLNEIVRRILAIGNPLKIVMFGSRARGDSSPVSDLDLLIMEESSLPRWRRALPYVRALADVFPAIEVMVWTPEEAQEWSEVPAAFITTALHEGKTIYGR
jgi:uncharacterized protein